MTSNLKKRTSQLHFSVKRIISVKEKLSIITIIFLVIGLLTMGEILVEVNSPPTIRTVGKSPSGFEFPIRPYQIYELQYARYALSVATGQSVSINITTTNLTALKLTPVIFASTEQRLNLNQFDPNNPLVSFNTTYHLFTLPPAEYYTVYCAFIKNLTNQTVYFEGYIKSSGFNHDFLWMPLFLLSCYGLIVGGSFGISQIISFFNRKKHNNDTEKVGGTANQSFISSFSRIKLLWKLHRQEIGLSRVIIITLLLWFTLQPMITMIFTSTNNGCHTWQAVLENAESYLITPLNRTMLLIAAVMVIDTSEVIVSKKARRDIMVTLSLPVTRLEWFLSTFFWIFYRYGLIFVLIFLIKVFVISLQIRLIYPWLSLIGWLSLFLGSFLTWISIGLLVSSTSNTRASATIKGLVAILIGLIFIQIIGGGHYEYCCDYGILNIEGIAFSFWHHFGNLECETMPVVQVQGIIVKTLPYLDNLVTSIRLLGLWFLLCMLILYFVLRNYEVN